MYPSKNLSDREHPALAYIRSMDLERKADLSSLETFPGTDTIHLVVDGLKILDEVKKATRNTEPLSPITSSIPSCAYQCITDSILLFRELHSHFSDRLNLLVVFDGCGYRPTEGPQAIHHPLPPNIISYRVDGPMDRQSLKNSEEYFRNNFYVEEDVEAFIVRYLNQLMMDRNIGKVMRAPYLCWSQISALFAPGNLFASEVYGNIELLAFPGVKRVITSIDIKTKSFTYVDKEEFTQKVRAKHANFDIGKLGQCLLYRSFFHEFVLENDAKFEDTIEQHPRSLHVDKFQLSLRTAAALEAPVLVLGGDCRPLRELYNTERNSSCHLFFGKPLPTVMFYYLSSGLLTPAPFASVGQSCLWDRWPLVDSKLFRCVSDCVVSLRAQTLHSLKLDKEGRGDRRLDWQRDYNQRQARTTTIAIPSATTLCYWEVDETKLSDRVYFSDVLEFANHPLDKKAKTKQINSTVAAILLRTIDLLGYVSHRERSATLSHIGKCLMEFQCNTLSEYGLLFIELLRTQTLNDEPLCIAVNTEPHKYPPGARLAARLLSIIPINSTGVWSGPIDPEIAAFGGCSRIMYRALRSLVEVQAVSVFYEDATELSLEDFPAVIDCLPFACVTEFKTGILVMYIILDSTCTLESLQKTFPQLTSLECDLQVLEYFWSEAYKAHTQLCFDSEEKASFFLTKAAFDAANVLMVNAFNRLLPRTRWAADP